MFEGEYVNKGSGSIKDRKTVLGLSGDNADTKLSSSSYWSAATGLASLALVQIVNSYSLGCCEGT